MMAVLAPEGLPPLMNSSREPPKDLSDTGIDELDEIVVPGEEVSEVRRGCRPYRSGMGGASASVA